MSTPTPPWNFSETQVTFDNPGYLWDGSVPGGPPPPPPSPSLPTDLALYGDREVYPPLIGGSQVVLPTDFISKLQPGETIVSAAATMSVYSGTDPNPSAMILGSPTIFGTVVNVLVGGGVLGVIYEFKVVATTSLGQKIPLTGYLVVVPDLV